MSGCGKSTWISKLLLFEKIQPPPERIVWLYMQPQPLYEELASNSRGLPIEFIQGLPSDVGKPEFFDRNIRNVLISDDLMLATGIDKVMADLFIHASSHRNVSVLHLVHNLFWKGSLAREIRLNAKYLIAFKNPTDKDGLLRIGRQIFPRQMDYFIESLEYAFSKPHSYIIIDMHVHTDEKHRLFTDIFGENSHNLPIYFLPRHG